MDPADTVAAEPRAVPGPEAGAKQTCDGALHTSRTGIVRLPSADVLRRVDGPPPRIRLHMFPLRTDCQAKRRAAMRSARCRRRCGVRCVMRSHTAHRAGRHAGSARGLRIRDAGGTSPASAGTLPAMRVPERAARRRFCGATSQENRRWMEPRDTLGAELERQPWGRRCRRCSTGHAELKTSSRFSTGCRPTVRALLRNPRSSGSFGARRTSRATTGPGRHCSRGPSRCWPATGTCRDGSISVRPPPESATPPETGTAASISFTGVLRTAGCRWSN